MKTRIVSQFRFSLCFIASFLIASLLLAQPSTWIQKQRPNTLGTAAFSIGTKGYYVTERYSSTNVAYFYEYDPATDVWTRKADYPGAGGVKMSAFSIGSKGYVGLGNIYNGTDVWVKDFWEYDPSSNTWTRKADFGGAGRTNAVGFSIGSKGYFGVGFFGGRNSVPGITAYIDFWEYDPAGNSWTKKSDYPGTQTPWNYAKTGFSTTTKGYIGLGNYTKEFWEFDPSSNSWTRKADYIGETNDFYGSPSFSINDIGYVGLSTYNNNLKFYQYNPVTNTWKRELDFLGDPDYYGGKTNYMAFSIGNKGYLGASPYIIDFWEFTPRTTNASCLPSAESLSLAKLYSITNGSNWKNKWTGSDEATWYGVTIAGCHVTELSLKGNNLQGKLPTDLAALTQLTKLELSDNNLSDSIPASLLSLPNLISLNLSGNSLYDTIPNTIGASLQKLNLSNNKISGAIPSVVGNATQLTMLDLGNNQLAGNIPVALWSLPLLTSLKLSSNQLSGSIPSEIGTAPSLVALDLSNNNFSGKIPKEITGANTLSKLNLSGNHLRDSLPFSFDGHYFSVLNISNNELTYIPNFANFGSYLDTLNVENNKLGFQHLETNYNLFYQSGYCCKLFTYSPQQELAHEIIQKTIGSDVTLKPPFVKTNNNYFQWYKNNTIIRNSNNTYYSADTLTFNPIQTSDQAIYRFTAYSSIIPNFTLTASYILNLSGATTGVIPASEREALIWLYYSTNGDGWFSKTNWLNADESTWQGVTVANGHVTQLALFYNGLNGSLPSELGNLSEIEYLYISGNSSGLKGTIPASLGNLSKLKYLTLSDNSFSGSIPSSLGKLSELESLDIQKYAYYGSGDKLSGNLPPELGNLTKLIYLKISGDNNLASGSIPSTYGKLTKLYELSLTYCNISGSVPEDLISTMPNLQTLDLSYNQLSGAVPDQLRRLYNVNLSNNQLTGNLPANLGTAGSTLRSLNLSFNLMNGGIPTQLGTWDNVQYLNLRKNQFSGNLPVELGDMNAIFYLDLGENQLTSTIPKVLANSIKIRYLLLDNNQLTGTIPKELGLLNLEILQLNNNQLTGILPVELGNATNLYNLRLNNNQLTGSIPTEYGALTKLNYLYLNNNQLTGTLPTSLGSLNKLYDLSLAYNQLTGTIPSGMGNPSYMSILGLNDNQFTGALPAYYGTITNSISQISLQNNQFTDIPKFTATSVYGLNTENNLLDFGDLELNAGTHPYYGGYTYSPQSTVLPGGNVNSTVGCPLTIPFTTPGAFNKYQWYKDGTLITGATSKEFTLPNGSTNDSGSYTVSVTNTKLTGLTLTSAPWIVTIGGTPLTPPTANDVSACNSSSLTLTATGAVGTQEYRWFDVATGGISLASTNTFNTPILTASKNYYVSIFDPSGNCESTRKLVVATILDIAPTATGGGACGASVTISLSASGASNGQYRWYTTSTGGIPIAGEVNSVFITPSISTTTTFYVSINNGVCESPRAAAVATVSTIAAAQVTTPPTICDAGSAVLNATGGVDGQYRWYTTGSGGLPIIGEVNGKYTTPSTTSTQSYFVAINNGACESNRTEVIVTVAASPAAPAGISNQGCQNASIGLNASGGTNGQYRWYTASTGGTAIAGQTNDTFIPTPALTATTSFWVAINNGTCESTRTEVIATVLPLPATPTVSPAAAVCVGSNITLTASGTTNGNYRWYDGANIISGQVNSQLVVTNLASNKIFQVSIFDGTCEGSKANANASIKNCTAPAVASTTATAFIEGEVKIDLRPLISDPENDLDESTLQVSSISSGAPYSLSGMVLSINYAGFPFTGIDVINLSVCDLTSLCTTQTVTIELGGNITVYNAISPNGDNKNPTFHIQYIDILPETKNNRVTIFNRWGDVVFEVENYDNTSRVFRGLDNSGDALPPGTYFYKIKFANGGSEKTGFIALRK